MIGRILALVPCVIAASAFATGATTPTEDLRARIHVPAADSGIAGRWTAQINGDSRIFPVNFEFIVKGQVLSGTVEFPSFDKEFPIERGTIKGNTIAFQSFGDWKGTLVGEELRLTRELDYGKKQQMVAHRRTAARPA